MYYFTLSSSVPPQRLIRSVVGDRVPSTKTWKCIFCRKVVALCSYLNTYEVRVRSWRRRLPIGNAEDSEINQVSQGIQY